MRQIIIETDAEEYTGGQTVRGQCTVVLDEQLPVRGVRVRCQGFEHSHWSSGSGKNRHTHSETAHFFNDELTVFGKPALGAGELIADAVKGLFSRDGYEMLGAGEHRWEFEYPLPPELPPDFESGGSSRIAYELTAYVDLPLRLDLAATRRLGMRGSQPAPEVQPVVRENSKTFLLDSSGPMGLRVGLERNVFRPGEHLHGAAEVTNSSGKQVRGVNFALQRTMHLKAGSSSTTRVVDVGSAVFPPPEASRGRPGLTALGFDLPGDLYPTISGTRLVRVSYQVTVSLDVPWAIDLAVSLPVTVV